jgi:hypothetical protein
MGSCTGRASSVITKKAEPGGSTENLLDRRARLYEEKMKAYEERRQIFTDKDAKVPILCIASSMLYKRRFFKEELI